MSSAVDGLLKFRCIGPFRGGRVVAVSGDPRDMGTFYFGACAGGIWKTDDGGQFWENISDGFLKTSSVGALEVAPADPNVIYAGMGESTIRIDVSHGDGVYKSTNAGKTWQHMGLENTRHIGKVRTHPDNPDIVYVAALGHAFGKDAAKNTERGVFKSVDGGQTWKKTLYKSNKAGAVDLSIDKNNPRIIYASIWQAYRNFWEISSGGPDSGLYRSDDGGDTWTEISRNKGMPNGMLGKMGVVASPVKSGRVWTIVEHATKGGIYLSDDYGDTWEHVSDNQKLISRAWYYMHLTADTQDADTVYVNNLSFWKSTDAGRNFTEIATRHGDNHDLWIDPVHPNRMVQGNDGGAHVSFNGGYSWSTIYNQPTSQFYHLDVDHGKPYKVYGTQQDNSSVAVPSRSENASIHWSDGHVAGTGESGYLAVNPKNPDVVFVGAIGSTQGGGNGLQRYDHKTKQIRLVTTWPEEMTGYGAKDDKYRFFWTYPIFFSKHNPDTLYIAGNYVFKSTNEGQSWQKISKDLSTNNVDRMQPTGGPINRDSVGAEVYCVVFSLAESHFEAGTLWAGTDDGRVHITKNDGKKWTEITPKKMPVDGMVTMLEPSPHDPATCYMTVTKYKLDDYSPYVFKTTNYGKTWTAITTGIASDDFVRCVREDPSQKDLLYIGTETGLYLSFDAGKKWQRIEANFPVTPVYDMMIRDNDLVVATHGRAFWILDDLSPLHGFKDSMLKSNQLFVAEENIRIMPKIFEGGFGGAPGKNYMATLGIDAAYVLEESPEGSSERRYLDTGQNPAKGMTIRYYLKDEPKEPITLTFKDSDGKVIRSLTSLTVKEREDGRDPERNDVAVPAAKGFNRFVWDMYYPKTSKIKGEDFAAQFAMQGPMIVPGEYIVELTASGKTISQTTTVIKEPSVTTSDKDLKLQLALHQKIFAKTEEGVLIVNSMRDVRKQLTDWQERAADHKDVVKQAEAVTKKVRKLEERLAVPDLRDGWPDTFNNGARLLSKLNTLSDAIKIGDYKPTDQAHEVYEHLSKQVDTVVKDYIALQKDDLAKLSSLIAKKDKAHIVV